MKKGSEIFCKVNKKLISCSIEIEPKYYAKSGSMQKKERLVKLVSVSTWENDDYCIFHFSFNLFANLVLFYCMTITVNLVPFFKIIFLYLFQLAIYIFILDLIWF